MKSTAVIVLLVCALLSVAVAMARSPIEEYPFEIFTKDGGVRPMTVEDIENSPDGTILNLNLQVNGEYLSLIKLENAREIKKKQQELQAMSPSYAYNINIPNDFMNNRFPSQFASEFLTFMNEQNQTYQGYKLNFVQAEILGFPPTPIPQTGHVTHEFMQEMGGLNITLTGIQFSSLTPMFVPYGFNSALFVNDATTEQQHENTYSQEITNSYTATFEQGFDLGFSESITAGVPDCFSSETTIDMQWSFDSTETSEKSITKTITDSTTIFIAPESVVNVTCFVQMGHLSTNFNAQVVLSGSSNVGWVFQDSHFYPPGQAWFWFLPPYTTINGLETVAGWFYNTLSMDYTALGVFNGVAGDTDTCYIYQCPYVPGITECQGNQTVSVTQFSNKF
eukprot:TRINITY_DN173_c0_g1_i1.p1 TRINITY_DN173_c0_g1~~TRINITY_DN173_c0_g1_i1.p1  ORF type:complete len:410 (-),score=90.73 TRINITY_DN173_c0_g1_i1:82-1260(-)